MRKGRTLVRGTLLLTLSGLALRGLGVLFQAVLAKRVGAAGMGVLQLVLTVGGFAGTLGSAGVRTAALQLAARAWGRGDRPGFTASLLACLRYGLLASAAAGAGLILLAAPLSELLLRDGRTVPALRTLGLLLPLPILAGVLRAVYTACGRVKELAAVELTERLLSLGVTFLLLALAGSDPARVCAAVIGGSYGTSVFSCLVLLLRLRGSLPEAGPLPPVARRALPLGLNDCLRSGLGTVEQFLIPWGLERSGSRTAALAAYGTVSGMVFPLLWFPAEGIFALSELMVSELARLLAKKEHRRMKRLVRKSLGLTALYALGIFAALWLGGGALGRALFKSEQAGRYLRIFAAMVLFLYPDAVVDGLQKGLGQQLHLVRYNSFTNVIDVLGLWLLLPRYGLAGYIFTYCLSHLVNFFLSLRRLLIVVENPELCE
ncbi:MAG: oligosaccharide flippase family protein [Oscillospiraceae bacterium]|nr:oligosaccharide flippase family protein [Oscillospiraceae bacterium]